jgi:hypothetical protein
MIACKRRITVRLVKPRTVEPGASPRGEPPRAQGGAAGPAAPLGLCELRDEPCAGAGVVDGRRRDVVEVIGAALAMAARGAGHRRIASQLGRSPETVRGWLRCARRSAQPLRVSGVRWWVALEPEPGPVRPAGSELADAVEAILLAVRAWTLRFGRTGAGPWERAQSLTGGLLSPRPALPP